MHCEYIGGGFGSKFAADYWGIAAAEIAKATGRPVKFMLPRPGTEDRRQPPSGFIKVRLGADENGVVQVWDSQQWGTAGPNGRRRQPSRVIPYVFDPKNYRRRGSRSRPTDQPAGLACAQPSASLRDLADGLRRLGRQDGGRQPRRLPAKPRQHLVAARRPRSIADEMKIAAELMDWKAKWHPHGKGPKHGSVVDGLGMASTLGAVPPTRRPALLRIHPDGGVESYCGTQDLGTGTRTVCALVLAETLGPAA